MPKRQLPVQYTEYRFTGIFRPAGPDHPLADRRGHPCEVVGYDLNLDRDVPLTFLISFSDGLETHVLPEEVDDGRGKPGSRPHDTNVPAHLRGGYYQRSHEYLSKEVVATRLTQYEALVFGDRFDGTPNSDHHRGEEAALRAYADLFGLQVPDPGQTQEAALTRLGAKYPASPDVADFQKALSAGQDWEGRG